MWGRRHPGPHHGCGGELRAAHQVLARPDLVTATQDDALVPMLQDAGADDVTRPPFGHPVHTRVVPDFAQPCVAANVVDLMHESGLELAHVRGGVDLGRRECYRHDGCGQQGETARRARSLQPLSPGPGQRGVPPNQLLVHGIVT